MALIWVGFHLKFPRYASVFNLNSGRWVAFSRFLSMGSKFLKNSGMQMGPLSKSRFTSSHVHSSQCETFLTPLDRTSRIKMYKNNARSRLFSRSRLFCWIPKRSIVLPKKGPQTRRTSLFDRQVTHHIRVIPSWPRDMTEFAPLLASMVAKISSQSKELCTSYSSLEYVHVSIVWAKIRRRLPHGKQFFK